MIVLMCLGESQCGIASALAKPWALRSPCIPGQPTESPEDPGDSLNSRLSQPQRAAGQTEGRVQCRDQVLLRLQVPRCRSQPLRGQQLWHRSTAWPAPRPRRPQRQPRSRAEAPAPEGPRGRRLSRQAPSDSRRSERENPASRRGWGQRGNIPPGP